MSYINRLSDNELQRKLNSSGAILIRGAKACGKTESASLNKFVSILDDKRVKPPKSLNIITGTGISYTRTDGINVISLASLGK